MMMFRFFRERRDANSEAGTAFLLVIVLVAVVGVIAGAALVYAQTSMSASIAYQGQRANVADAENAIRTAIQYAAANPSVYTDLGTTTKNGATVQQCASPAVSVGSMNVAICANAGSGVSSGIPRAAILSLGTSSSEDGIAKGSSGTMRVDGGIFSNTNINAKATISVLNGDVYARGACDSSVFTVASGHTINCNYGTTTNAIGSDPNFAPLISAPPATATLPSACSGSVKTATLVPGTYTSASALSAITTSCDLTILAPGVYYFNFPSSDSIWTISKNGHNLVGGTVVSTTAFPGGCDATNANGVQLVFGGYSRLDQNGGHVELCAPYSTDSNVPQIAIYGVKSGTGTLTPQAGCLTTPGSGGCAFLANSGAGTGLAINGTVYLPLASLNLQMTNISNQLVTRGLVIRSLSMQITGSSSFTGNAFGVPGTISTTGAGDAIFTAYTTKAWISARVKFATTGTPTIVSWVSCTRDASVQSTCQQFTPL
jgi:hypothetical protein